MAETTLLGTPRVRSSRRPTRAGKSYHIRTFGCQMNEHDSERISGLLADDGMKVASTIDDADVIVLNTCVVRQQVEDKVFGRLGALRPIKAQRPDTVIALSRLPQRSQHHLLKRLGEAS